MKKGLKREDQINYGIICLFMTFSLSYVIGTLMQVEFNGIQKLITVLLVAVPSQLLVLYPILLYPLTLITILVTLGVYRFDPQIVIGWVQWLAQFSDNIMQNMKGNELIAYENATAFWILITLLMSIGTAWAIFRSNYGSRILLIYLLPFLYYWYTYVNGAYGMMVVFLICYIIWVGLEEYRQKEANWGLNETTQVKVNKGYWSSIATLYSVTIIILALIVPKPTAQLQWNWLNQQVMTYFPTVINLRDDVDYRRNDTIGLFDFSMTGFQSTPGRLGGPVAIDHTPIMKVKSPQPLYLRGNVRRIYDGSRWTDSQKEKVMMSTSAVTPVDEVAGELVTLEITYQGLDTRTIFTPYQPQEVILQEGRLMIDEDYAIHLEGRVQSNRTYQVTSLIPGNIEEVQRIHTGDQISSDYLQIPSSLPQRVTQLASTIVSEVTEPYDQARAIEGYLRNNYPYSLTVSRVPQYEDFVDYFLFEEQAGYCTYYATAMAIMLRTQGIPARYIEGYRMPQENEDGVYTITQANAHAWVEAYIEGYGWMTFEPTAAYPRLTPEPIAEGDQQADIQSTLDEMELLMQSVFGEAGAEAREDVLQLEGILQQPDTQIQGEEGIKDKLKANVPILVAILFCGLVPLRIFSQYMKQKRRMKRLKEKCEKEQIPYIYQWTLDLLAKLGEPVGEGETPYEYAQRTAKKAYRGEEDFRDLTALYMEVKYSPREATAEERDRLLNYLQLMDEKVRYHLGTWKYLYVRYIRSGYYR